MHCLSARDPDSLTAVYDRYASLSYSVLIRITRDEGTAQDLLQELFLRVWTRNREYDFNRGSLGVWILSIARNLGIDHLRSVRARCGTQLQPLRNFDTLPAEPDQRESLLANMHLVRKTLSSLSIRQRQVLELAYFEGCSHSEIAERLEAPLGTVKGWMRAALQSARVAIESVRVISAA
ncbi:MAG: sigma-70 family RNA polymerase sigma factor [Acidobacteriota bacterium]|nr:sigma-70 family RNA polymerase sigma factor [Acidobacteriota bacterium]